MTRSLYGDPDYVFGQRMLALRTSIGLTQEGLAAVLGLTRKAIGRWEAGEAYPKAAHLQALLALALQHRVFAAGEEQEEIRAFWRAAHQKVLLDEAWLNELLSQQVPLRLPAPAEQSRVVEQLSAPNSGNEPQVDWGEALDVSSFYGRASELALLSRWIGEDRCRIVSVLGIGGIGKSALAVTVMYQVARQFDVVIWRSLRDMPNSATLLETCLQVLAPQAQPSVSDVLEDRLRLLMEQLRTQRVLLMLDNVEALLEGGTSTGRLRADAEGYARLLRAMGETRHQSCLLLTSREKLTDLVPLEGKRSPVRALRLAGLDEQAGVQLLEEKEIVGSPQDLVRLVEVYRGNPLALKIVGQTIMELFGSEIVRFLAQGELVFGGVRELLDEQFDRLSVLEQRVFCWLAILREPVGLEGLQAVLNTAWNSAQVFEALDRLLRRSLIERGQLPGSFTLQSVVLEYATGRLIAEVTSEIEQGRLTILISHALCQAQAKEYVRQIQERLLVVSLLNRLRSTYRRQADLEARLRSLLDDLRRLPLPSQGYGPANLIALLGVLRGDLRGLDLSRLAIRGAYLQGVEMQDSTLSEAALRDSVFTESFDAIWAVATSPSGQDWATGSKRGEVRLWREAGQILRLAWQAHTDIVMALAFSPDGRTLASGSLDGTVKLWDVESGALHWTVWHVNSVIYLAFTSDGYTLASAGNETLVRLWDTKLGTALDDLPHPGPVFALAWSPDGRLLASGGFDGSIRVWQRQQTGPAHCVQTLTEHTNWVRGLAFAPDGSRLASASWDGTVKLWDRESGCCLETLTGHTERVHCVAWSSDGRTLASGGIDPTIWLWDAESRTARAALRGHSATVNSLTFTPDSRSLLSGSDDGTLRVWEVERGEALRIMKGYAVALYDVAWSPDGTQLASAGSDTLVTVWKVGRGEVMPPSVLRGHRWIVYGVGWRPDGSLLASSGWDNAIRLWDPATGSCVQILQDLEMPDTLFWGVAWSPDGGLLASGTYHQGVQVWDAKAHSPLWADRAHSTWIRRVAWSPDGTRLVGGDEDGQVYVWDASNGTLLHQLPGHHGAVMSVAFSPDGSRLATSSGFSDSGELVVWDTLSGTRVQGFVGHPGMVTAVAWTLSGEFVVSGGSDGMVRWWEVESGKCVQVQQAHQGTVQALKLSPNGSILASCGEDGVITLWDLKRGKQFQTLRRDRPYERLTITGIRGLSDAQKASLRALGAFEETSVSG
jgi:WD40 repeat protein/transcriptional regulator with XRE-family HTH domain